MSGTLVSAKKAFLQVAAAVLTGASGTALAADFNAVPAPPPLRQKNGEIDTNALLRAARGHYEQRHKELAAPKVQDAMRGDDLPVTVRRPATTTPVATNGVKPYNREIMGLAEGVVSALGHVRLNLGTHSEGTHFNMMNKMQDPGAQNKYDSRLSRAYKAAKETKKPQVFSTISGDPDETYQFAMRVNPDGSAVLIVRERAANNQYGTVFAAALSDNGTHKLIDPKTVSVASFGLKSALEQVPLEPQPITAHATPRNGLMM